MIGNNIKLSYLTDSLINLYTYTKQFEKCERSPKSTYALRKHFQFGDLEKNI